MDSSPKQNNLELLLSSSLIHHQKIKDHLENLKQASNSIAYLVAHELVMKKNFYPNLANLLNLSYITEIPLPLSSNRLMAQHIPNEILAKYNIIPYEKDGQLYLAVDNPFITSTVTAEIISFTPYDKYTLVLCHPSCINEAIISIYRTMITIEAEESVSVLHPQVSVIENEPYAKITRRYLILFFIFLGVTFIMFPFPTVIMIFFLLNLMYLIINPFKIYTFLRAFKFHENIVISRYQIRKITYKELPIYTILIPLRGEENIVQKLLKNILKIDYPKDKLDVKFIVDSDDFITIKALKKLGLGKWSNNASKFDYDFFLVQVPKGQFATKPRACNFGLQFARGSLTVIYDAEDRPDRFQLKKAFLGFLKSNLDIICIQAKLNFYNWKQNLLTRFFSLEYNFWYDYFLPGLQTLRGPLPLGGTSNHLITQSLRKIGIWDPYNVTEDADLGLRLSRYKYRTAILESYTHEEANSQIWGWIKQRTRWEKGFLQTFIVHMRSPLKIYHDLGAYRFILSFITFGSSFFLPFVNPFLWVLFMISLSPGLSHYLPGFPRFILQLGIFNLVAGNLSYIFVHLVSGLVKKRYDLVLLSLALPFYWILISIATYRAIWHFYVKPFMWEKTRHGLR